MSTFPSMDDADRAARTAEVHTGARISAFIHDPLVQEVLNGLLHGAQNAWMNSTDRDEREQLWLRARGIIDLTTALKEIVTTGEMASQQLLADRELKGENE